MSIAISQICLAAALLGTLWQLARQARIPPRRAAIEWPLLLFFIWTVLAALASPDIPLSLTIIKKFFIFLLVFLVPLLVRGPGRTIWIYHAIFVVAGVSSLVGLGQFIANPERDLLNRISGFMSQWMTYSGLQMLVLIMLCAYALCFGPRLHWWIIPLGLLLSTSLIFSFTRNAWLGAVVGIAVALWLLKYFRALAGLVLLLSFLYLAAPLNMRERLRASWNIDDPNTRNRIELMETSFRLIRDNPWFGVGPKNVKTEALRYRGANEFPDWMYQHMHNNFLQIAAERGIPGLLLWLWFMGRLAWDALLNFRSLPQPGFASANRQPHIEGLMSCVAALAAWVALLIAGMFEYNFGDSEILTLFLFIMSAPYAALDRFETVNRKNRRSKIQDRRQKIKAILDPLSSILHPWCLCVLVPWCLRRRSEFVFRTTKFEAHVRQKGISHLENCHSRNAGYSS